jgi:hypothetical protein
MSIHNSGGQITPYDRTTYFPIFTDGNDFRRLRNPRRRVSDPLRGLSEEARAIVEGLQPYNSGDESLESDPLFVLNELWNQDKHRIINIVFWSAVDLAFWVRPLHESVVVHRLWTRPVGPIENGAVILELDYSVDPDFVGEAMYMNRNFWFGINFAQPNLFDSDVLASLTSLAAYTRGTIESLRYFIPE